MTGIYLIKNLINNKIYIGQQIDIEKRIHEHFWKAKCKKDISYKQELHAAIRKYGEESFLFGVVEECDENELDEKEIYYIEKYHSVSPNGYNILLGGQKFRAARNINRCIDCGAIITRNACRCLTCLDVLQNRKLDERYRDFNNRENFKSLIRLYSFEEIGRMFGVTGKAIAKRCIRLNLPHIKRIIK